MPSCLARWVTQTGPPLGVAAGTSIRGVVARARVIRSHAEVATLLLRSAAKSGVVPAWPCPPIVPRGASLGVRRYPAVDACTWRSVRRIQPWVSVGRAPLIRCLVPLRWRPPFGGVGDVYYVASPAGGVKKKIQSLSTRGSTHGFRHFQVFSTPLALNIIDFRAFHACPRMDFDISRCSQPTSFEHH